MDAFEALDALAGSPLGLERVRHLESLPNRPARHASTKEPLSDDVLARLRSFGITDLYAHQAAAIDHLRAGQSVVVATGTASGKSLCYQIPIAEAIASGRPATALALFPTKALAQDQLRSLRSWLVPGLKAVTYDGDTPDADRAWARKHANIVLTNPDMLHVGILPAHQRWATFFMRLEYVVIDELHALRGIFGSHVALLLRRLRRISRHYGSDPVFCFSSATIGNPAELASALCGLDVEPIVDDGAPRAARRLAIWDRPLEDTPGEPRLSANAECGRLLAEFVAAGQQTLAFTRSRKGAELVAQHARRQLTDGADPAQAETVTSYRAGYLPKERRAIEQRLVERELLGIAATNALELGIDIGGLDAVIVNGFPGTMASFWQQIGRSGRSGARSAAVLVVGDDQLDQWYLRHPSELVSRPPERVVVNPDNPFVTHAQIACATHELPLTRDDDEWFGAGLDDVVTELVQADLAKPRGGKLYWAGREPPAPRVSLRSGSNDEIRIVDVDNGEIVGTVDGGRSHAVVHPGAIYLHLGRQYRVERLDEPNHVALATPADDLDEFTQARSITDISIVDIDRSGSIGPATVHVGSVAVASQVTGYQRRHLSNGRVIETVELDLPERVLQTRACWYTVPLAALVRAGVEPVQLLGTVHAAEHGLIGLLPLFTICDRWDVGGVSMATHPQTGEPSIFVYDGYPGGAGIAELAFDAATDHVRATLDLIERCSCADGCPSCVQSPKCGNFNEYLDKAGAIRLLRLLS